MYIMSKDQVFSLVSYQTLGTDADQLRPSGELGTFGQKEEQTHAKKSNASGMPLALKQMQAVAGGKSEPITYKFLSPLNVIILVAVAPPPKSKEATAVPTYAKVSSHPEPKFSVSASNKKAPAPNGKTTIVTKWPPTCKYFFVFLL